MTERSALRELTGALLRTTESELRLGRVLWRIRAKALYEQWGHQSLQGWLDSRNVGLKMRKVEYLVRIVGYVDALRLPERQVHNAGIAKLRMITRLPPEFDTQIRSLLAKATSMSLADVRASVDELLHWTHKRYLPFTVSLCTSSELALVKATLTALATEIKGTRGDALVWLCNNAQKKQPKSVSAAA